jgi:[acyl-carrier-protein] S-malonyltransferase
MVMEGVKTMEVSKICALFPGQGSQSTGMGKAWYESSSQARELFSRADDALGYPISKLCFEGPLEELTLTQNAQPALLLVSYVSYLLSGIRVDAAAGHSLGEFTALVAAEVISFEDALILVHKRGTYMQDAVPVGQGAMLAVMGPSEEEVSGYIAKGARGVVEIANLNSPGQTVLSGQADAIKEFSAYLSEKGAKVIPLNVSAPFHSSLMQPAAEKLSTDLDAVVFNDPRFPVYANVTAKEIVSAEEARDLLKKQVCGTVRWTAEVGNLVHEQSITHAIEFGPGGVLSKLLKRTIPEVRRFQVSDPDSGKAVKMELVSKS